MFVLLRVQVVDNPFKSFDRTVDLALLWGVAIAPLLLTSTLSFAGADLGIRPQDASLRIGYQMLQQFIGLGVLVYLLWKQGRNFTDIGINFCISDLPKSLAVFLVAYIGFIVVYLALPQGAASSEGADRSALLGGLVSANVILLMCFTAINPIFEELIVRAYAIIEIEQITGSRVIAVAVSTGIQAFYHLYQGWRWAIASAAIFLVFSLCFAYRKRAVPIILAHFYMDAIFMYGLLRQV